METDSRPRFKPVAPGSDTTRRNVKIELPPDEYAAVKSAAKMHGVSMKEFVRQALRFAMDNLEPAQ